MRAWRLALGRYAEFDGEGARLYGGRWNSPGVPVIYAATHLSLAFLEQLVHCDPVRLPTGLRVFAIDLPDTTAMESAKLPPDDIARCRQFGDAWAASRRSAALLVPSAVVPPVLEPGGLATGESNVVLNPRHAAAATWRVTATDMRIDPRLRRTGV